MTNGGWDVFAYTMICLGVIWLCLLVSGVIGGWRIFVKAGHPGWHVIIPGYNIYAYHQIIGLPKQWFYYVVIGCCTWLVIDTTGVLFGGQTYASIQPGFVVGVLMVSMVYGFFVVRMSYRAFGLHAGMVRIIVSLIFPIVLLYRLGFGEVTYVSNPSLHDLPQLPWLE